MKRAIKIKVLGKVQGVFFRASTKKYADQLGVKGWVRNETDGSVQIIAESEMDNIDRFIKWCYRGPEFAVVEKVIVSDEVEVKNYESFEVRR